MADRVRWNYAVAEQAERALRQRADTLDAMLDARLRLAQNAQDGWSGRYREQFDDELADLVGRGRRLASALRAKADDIRQATVRARAEQRRRDEERRREEERRRQQSNP